MALCQSNDGVTAEVSTLGPPILARYLCIRRKQQCVQPVPRNLRAYADYQKRHNPHDSMNNRSGKPFNGDRSVGAEAVDQATQDTDTGAEAQ